MTEDTRNVSVQ